MARSDYILMTNSSAPKESGLLVIQVSGSGSVPTVKIGATTYNLDTASLASSNLKEYSVHVVAGVTVQVAGATVVNLFLLVGPSQ